MNSQEKSLTTEKMSKKAYTKPHLEVYGDLAQITRSTGRNGTLDGASTGNTKSTRP